MQANLQQGTLLRNHYSPNRAASQVSMKFRVKRNQCQDLTHQPNQLSRSGQNLQQGTLLRNHYSPNRAASQVSMKFRVKRNQCQDSNINPNSTAGQVRK